MEQCPKPTTRCLPDVPCAPTSFTIGNYVITYDGNCLTKTPRAARVADGWYSNVYIEDGIITKAERLPAQVVIPPSACTVNDAPQLPRLTGQGSNLLRVQDDALMADFDFIASERLVASGNGSTNDPFRIDLDIATVRDEVLAGGLDTGLHGWLIQRGIIQKMPGWPIVQVQNLSPQMLDINLSGGTLQIGIVGAVSGRNVLATRTLRCDNGANIILNAYAAIGGQFIIHQTKSSATLMLTAEPAERFATLQEAIDEMNTLQINGTTCGTSGSGTVVGGTPGTPGGPPDDNRY